jgi:peptidoglycan/LPS O-acetylase OafA/YrhL
VAIALYHLRPTRLEGGFIGVTLFFVLTGYFATSSYLRTWAGFSRGGKAAGSAATSATATTGAATNTASNATCTSSFAALLGTLPGVQFLRFYGHYLLKRIARLLPAVLALIFMTALGTYLFAPSILLKLQSDALPATLFYLNWSYIVREVPYFAAAGLPSPLTHLWYVAVVMQFYVLWPVVLWILCRVLRTRKPRMIAVGALALASTVAMLVLYNPQDVSGVYYNTFTRAAELLLGVLAALALPALRARLASFDHYRTPAALISFAVLVLAALFATGSSSWLFRGGYLVLAIASAVLVLHLALPSPTRRRISTAVFSLAPLTYLGSRSFSLYLVHFPIILWMNPASRTTTLTLTDVLIQLIAIMVATEIFYQVVEKRAVLPALSGAVVRLVRVKGKAAAATQAPREDHASTPAGAGTARLAAPTVSPSLVAPALGLLTVAILAFAPFNWNTIAIQRAQYLRPELAATTATTGVTEGETTESTGNTIPAGTVTLPGDITIAVGGERTTGLEGILTAHEALKLDYAPKAEKLPANLDYTAYSYDEETNTTDAKVLIVGDSVSLGAEEALKAALPNATVDAKISRQLLVGPQVLREHLDAGEEYDAIIVELGNNGVAQKSQFEDVVAALDGRPAYLVTNRVAEGFEGANNELIREVAAEHENVGIIDWYGASAGHSEYLYDDGLHLTEGLGAPAFAALFRQALVGR